MPTNGQQAQHDYFSLMLAHSQQVAAEIREEIAARSASRSEHLAALQAEIQGLDRSLEAYGRARDSRDQNQRRDMVSLANIQGGIERRNLSVSRRAASNAGSLMGDIRNKAARATANISDEVGQLDGAIDSFLDGPTDVAAGLLAQQLTDNTTLGVLMARYESGGFGEGDQPIGAAPEEARVALAMGIYDQLRVANAARMRANKGSMTDEQMMTIAANTQGVAPAILQDGDAFLAETSTQMSTAARQGTVGRTAGTAQQWLEENIFTNYSDGLVEDHNRAVASANRRETLIEQVDSLQSQQAASDPIAEQRELFAQRVTPSSEMMAMGTGIGGAVRRHFAGRRNAQAHQEQVDFLRNMSEEDRVLMEPFTDAQALLDSFGGNHPMDGSSWDVARELWNMRDGIADKATLVRRAAEMATGDNINERNASRDEILRNYTYLTLDGVGDASINARSQRQNQEANEQSLTSMATSGDELQEQAAANSIASRERAMQRNARRGDTPPPVEPPPVVPPSTPPVLAENTPTDSDGFPYIPAVAAAVAGGAVGLDRLGTSIANDIQVGQIDDLMARRTRSAGAGVDDALRGSVSARPTGVTTEMAVAGRTGDLPYQRFAPAAPSRPLATNLPSGAAGRALSGSAGSASQLTQLAADKGLHVGGSPNLPYTSPRASSLTTELAVGRGGLPYQGTAPVSPNAPLPYTPPRASSLANDLSSRINIPTATQPNVVPRTPTQPSFDFNPATVDLNTQSGQRALNEAADAAQDYIRTADINTPRAALSKAARVVALAGAVVEAGQLVSDVYQHGPVQGLVEFGGRHIDLLNLPADVARSEGFGDQMGIMPYALDTIGNLLGGAARRSGERRERRTEYDAQVEAAEADQLLEDRISL